MSPKYATVKAYYDNGLWNKERVYNAVGRWITEGEYAEITGEVYDGTAPMSEKAQMETVLNELGVYPDEVQA